MMDFVTIDIPLESPGLRAVSMFEANLMPEMREVQWDPSIGDYMASSTGKGLAWLPESRCLVPGHEYLITP